MSEVNSCSACANAFAPLTPILLWPNNYIEVQLLLRFNEVSEVNSCSDRANALTPRSPILFKHNNNFEMCYYQNQMW